MECTTKIWFLTWTCVKITTPKYYISDVQSRQEITKNVIEVKKEHTHNEGKRSKVLGTHATENIAD